MSSEANRVRTKRLRRANLKGTDGGCFLAELSLIAELTVTLEGPEPPVQCSAFHREFRHSCGQVDLVAIHEGSKIVTFEAKLTNWRRALHQAYRNTAFAHFSYVVLPSSTAKVALKHRKEFEQLGVGLLVLGGKYSALYIKPRFMRPLLPWITEKIRNLLTFSD